MQCSTGVDKLRFLLASPINQGAPGAETGGEWSGVTPLLPAVGTGMDRGSDPAERDCEHVTLRSGRPVQRGGCRYWGTEVVVSPYNSLRR